MSDQQREPGHYWLTFQSGWKSVAEFAEIPKHGRLWRVAGYSPMNDEGLAVIGAKSGPRVQAPAEIAAAIAAARAEGEKAGRDAGVAIGAANMRETCALVAHPHSDEAWSRDATTAIDVVCQRIAALALPTDATAILAAERAAGREEMRAACRETVDEILANATWDRTREQHLIDALDAIDALVLP